MAGLLPLLESLEDLAVDITLLTRFFMWCTIINGGLFIFWSLFFLFAPDLVYRIQTRVFPLPRETYDAVIYGFLGFFKALFLLFNLTPYLALLLLQ